MNQWNKNDRVALIARPEFVGTCLDDQRRGSVDVAFDGGGHGRFAAGDLQHAADAPVTDKTWPPGGLETKVLTP